MYQGVIRTGQHGQYSERDHTVWRCQQCGTGFLPDVDMDYTTSQYRQQVDGSSTATSYYQAHDAEQAAKLALVGTDQLRGKVVADIGCGAGSFLDLIRGLTDRTVAIEPSQGYHQALADKGCHVYAWPQQAIKDWEGQVDLAVCFSVLEHVADPVVFLKQARQLLRDGGHLLISTPNSDDWLLDFLPDIYGRFFFRQVHTWYFNQQSVRKLAHQAGLYPKSFRYVQRFGLSNALHWIRDHQPAGFQKLAALQDVDTQYRQVLEQQGQTDYLYVWLEA